MPLERNQPRVIRELSHEDVPNGFCTLHRVRVKKEVTQNTMRGGSFQYCKDWGKRLVPIGAAQKGRVLPTEATPDLSPTGPLEE